MLLKKLRYNNFRPFIGHQEIDFTPTDSKTDCNVTVILGENTFGKSTFVLSFIWCLYGESRFDRPTEILNKKIESKMNFGDIETAWVEIEFEDEDLNYTVRRTQHFMMGKNGKLQALGTEATLTYVNENGESITLKKYQNEVNDAIKAILPKDLSSFFFFEGEKDNAISKKDLGKAVRTLLGLEAFENMRKHLYGSQTQNTPYAKSVMGMYLSKQNDESDERAQEAFEAKVTAEEELVTVQKRIMEIKENISSYEKQIEQINDVLRQAAPSKELQKRRDSIKKELEIQEDSLRKNNKRILALFGRDSLPLLVTPLLEKVSDRLNEMDVADKGIKGIEMAAIMELLDRGVCLCGTDLNPGTVAYKNVEKYMDYVPPKSVGSLVRDMMETIESNKEKSKLFVTNIEEIYSDIQNNKVRINELEREERETLAEIAKIESVDTKSAEGNLSEYKNRISNLRDELERKISEEGSKKADISNADRIFNKYKSQSDKAKKYQLYYKYAQALYEWVNINYSKKESEMRERLNTYITELFNNMYTGEREIIIDSQYNITAVSKEGNFALTGGLRVIAYFAFVGGLVKLAYEVMKEREKNADAQALGERYPLVLDAAFSHADETHTKNIARELANAAHQLIFAVMPKDWQYAKEGISGRVSKVYELRKVDESEALILEVK